jgi:hypothetical protein
MLGSCYICFANYIGIKSILRLLNRVNVDDIAKVKQVHAASIFRFEVCRARGFFYV